MIEITILGSGTCVPSLKRSACSVLVRYGKTNLLLDSGPGTMRRLLEAGTRIDDISAIFFSHFHPDHSAEMAPFLFASKYPEYARRSKPLLLIGGCGFQTFYDGLVRVYGVWIQPGESILRIQECSSGGRERILLQGLTLETIPVAHSPESLAMRITCPEGQSLAYSGDTDMSENLVELARGVDLFICESSHPDEMKVRGHLTPSLAGEIATRAKVRKLLLTHFYPECEQADLRAQCRKTYAGRLALAKDLMTLTLAGKNARRRLPE